MFSVGARVDQLGINCVPVAPGYAYFVPGGAAGDAIGLDLLGNGNSTVAIFTTPAKSDLPACEAFGDRNDRVNGNSTVAIL